VGLLSLAIQPPLVITAFGFPPSTLAVEFYYSETRASSLLLVVREAVPRVCAVTADLFSYQCQY